jgi:hypothetical protein
LTPSAREFWDKLFIIAADIIKKVDVATTVYISGAKAALIEAYFKTGQQEKAKNLTRQLSLDGLLTREVICYSWLNLKDQETQPAEAENIEQLLIEFNCQVRK